MRELRLGKKWVYVRGIRCYNIVEYLRRAMKNIFIGFSLLAGFVLPIKAADGFYTYEVATTSIVVRSVPISSSAAVLVDPVVSQNKGDYNSIAWYSTTLYNQSTSSAAYAFCGSTYTAPAEATCALGVPLSAGTATVPFVTTERYIHKFYMWVISCGASSTLKVVSKGH
jgi:hypothetical protein